MERKITEEQLKIAESVLGYWHTIEFLSQDTLPELSYEEKKKNEDAVKYRRAKEIGESKNSEKKPPKVLKLLTPLCADDDLSTLLQRETERHGMGCWGNISIFVGRISREACIEKIIRTLQMEDKRPEKSEDKIAWFSLQISPDGEYIEKSFSISTIIWAVKHLEKGIRLSENLSPETYNSSLEDYGQYWEEKKKDELEEKCCVSVKDIYRFYQIFHKDYIRAIQGKEELCRPEDFFCLLQYQVFANEMDRERYENDDYLGLSRAFFVNDLNMVLSNVKERAVNKDNRMQRAMIDYIIGPYAQFYPEKKVLSFADRFNIEHGESGRKRAAELREFFADTLDVRNAPLGKWPSRFMPSFMQQIAVNMIVKEGTDNRPLFSVNGPPGTGKTTLLKEVIVNNIVKRASLLAKNKNPDDAFEECCFKHGNKESHGYSNWFPKYYKLKDDKINDYSILVTSCNNAAVENITKELPLEKKITGTLRASEKDSDIQKEQLNEVCNLFTVEKSGREEELYYKNIEKEGVYQDLYFTEYARNLLGNEDAWGLISAALGKRSNIHRFYNQVLYQLDVDFYKNDKINQRLQDYKECRERFYRQEEKVKKLQRRLVYYCETEKLFRENCRENEMRIRELKEGRQKGHSLLDKYNQQVVEISQKAAELEALSGQKRISAETAKTSLEKVEQQYNDADRAYEEKLKDSISMEESIGLLGRLFHSKSAMTKRELADKYSREAEEIKITLASLECGLKEARDVYAGQSAQYEECLKDYKDLIELKRTVEQKIKVIQNGLQESEQEIKTCKETIEQEIREYKKTIEEIRGLDETDRFKPLDDEFMEQYLSSDEVKSTKAQVADLWFTEYYNREREKLFYEALQLHKAFVLSSKCCLKNYRNLALMWQERKEENEKVKFHIEDKQASFGVLLQSLFLLVPVISTTFASVGNFLKDIKQPNVLGMVIVDEAGQAPPQMAVGALYRCRKAVIVGDPRQVEPVVTDDLLFLKNAFAEEVFHPYKSKKNSVQQFADLVNPYGTYLENEWNEMEWIGCPLVVHRRCISPMYEISNYISYNNKMKQQTGEPSIEQEERFCYPGSRWINIKGNERGNKNHFVEEQGKRVLEILEIAFSRRDEPSLFIITPFTTVKSGMIKYIESALYKKRQSVLYEKRECVKEWIYKNIGTVHTFQGREADEVIFLLGCDTSKGAAGAIQWVNANIVNVAVTRAKYRLYVLGDEAAWKESRQISQMKKIIDIHAVRELSKIVNEEDSKADREMVLRLCNQLPSVESVSIEQGEDGTDSDFIFSSDIYLNELKSGGLLLKPLTDKQLNGYGYTRETFSQLEEGVRQNLEWGMKLYTMLRLLIKRYQLKGVDASCCAILFCKALERQMKECFYENLKKMFPELKGIGVNRKQFANTLPDEMVIGDYQRILKNQQDTLSSHMTKKGMRQYDSIWWNRFSEQISQCRKLRNNCCHWKQFQWEQLNTLMTYMFLEDKGKPVMKGVMKDSMVGRYLGK